MCLEAWNNYCWCETRREPGHVNFPHDWKHLAVGNSLIVPHKKTKEGQAEDGAPLRKNSNEMWSCFLQIQHIFEKRKTEAGPVAIDLRCAGLQSRMIQPQTQTSQNGQRLAYNSAGIYLTLWLVLVFFGRWKANKISYCCSITPTICSTSVETICMQHMAVARAHTMVEMTLRAQTLNSNS